MLHKFCVHFVLTARSEVSAPLAFNHQSSIGNSEFYKLKLTSLYVKSNESNAQATPSFFFIVYISFSFDCTNGKLFIKKSLYSGYTLKLKTKVLENISRTMHGKTFDLTSESERKYSKTQGLGVSANETNQFNEALESIV